MLNMNLRSQIDNLLPLYNIIKVLYRDNIHLFTRHIKDLIINNQDIETDIIVIKQFYYAYRKLILDNFSELIQLDWNSLPTEQLYEDVLNDIQPVFEYSYTGKLEELLFTKYRSIVYKDHPHVFNKQNSREFIISQMIDTIALSVSKHDYYLSGKLSLILRGHSEQPRSVIFSHNRIVSTDDDEIIVWNAKTGHQVFKIPVQVDQVIIHNNQIITSKKYLLKIWNLTSGKLLKEISMDRYISNIKVFDSQHIIFNTSSKKYIYNTLTWQSILVSLSSYHVFEILPIVNLYM